VVEYPACASRVALALSYSGVFAGVGLTLVAVTVSTLIFGTYGYGLFLLTPFVIGAVTAYVANLRRTWIWGDSIGRRDGDCDRSLMLVAVAVEGVICIIMAAPIGIAMALIGALLGRDALRRRRVAGQPLLCIALLPLMFAVENVLPPVAISIRSRPSRSRRHPAWSGDQFCPPTDRRTARAAVPSWCRLPAACEVHGEGVGAERVGEFSTGTAIERVTEWVRTRSSHSSSSATSRYARARPL